MENNIENNNTLKTDENINRNENNHEYKDIHEKSLKENTEIKKLLIEKEEQYKKTLEQTKFLQAELENLKRRNKKEVLDVHKYAIKNFAKKLLNIIDSIEQGIKHIEDNKEIKVKSVKEGLDMTYKMFLEILKEFNIEQINSYEIKFNPEKHEAISIINDKNKDNNIIINTLQKGYMLNTRVLRTSKVIVCKK